jgi:thiazole/oxazole-forming peptide maturase SagD family component
VVAGLVAARPAFKYLPTSLLYFFYSGPAFRVHADSNGCAAGNTLEEAIVQGFLELVERDAYAIWWYNRLQRPEVDLASSTTPTSVICKRASLPETGRGFGCSTSPAISAFRPFVAIAHWMQNGRKISSSVPARISIAHRLLRAMTELNQFLSIGLMGGGSGEKSSLDGTTPLRLEGASVPDPERQSAGDPAAPSRIRAARQYARAGRRLRRDRFARAGLDFLVLDQTRPDIEFPVVRVIVPGLRHFYRRFAPGRLYDVPVKLGLLDRPLPGKRTHSVSSPHLRVWLARSTKKEQSRDPPPTISARLSPRITSTHADGSILACFDGHSISLGAIGPATAKRAQELRSGSAARLRLRTNRRAADREFELLVRRLAQRGSDWSTASAAREIRTTKVVIEPQSADYWPRMRPSSAAETAGAVAVRLFAPAWQRDGAGIAPRRSVGENLRSQDHDRLALLSLARRRRSASFSWQPGFPGTRAARFVGGLSNPSSRSTLPLGRPTIGRG